MTAILRILVAILFLAAPRGESNAPSWNQPAFEASQAELVGRSTLPGAPHIPGGDQSVLGEVRESAVGWHRYPGQVSGGAPQDASAVTFEGTLAYALPSYGARYLAIRQPRGTRVVVCGPAGCLTRISTDYGPSSAMARQGRIADLSAADWSRVCGVPLAFGLCPGTVTLVGLPQTDQ